MNANSHRNPTPAKPAEPFFGDLRKAAYLKRRAEYRLLNTNPPHGGKIARQRH